MPAVFRRSTTSPFAEHNEVKSRASSCIAVDTALMGLTLATTLSTELADHIATAISDKVSGPQGAVRPFTVISDPSAWKARDWEGRHQEFVLQLTASDVAALEQAVADMQAAGKPLTSLKRASDFPLPGPLTARLAAMKADLLQGRGFALVRGLPVTRWSEWQCLAAYMGIGAHIGYRGPQSKDGKLVNHVKMYYPPGSSPSSTAKASTPMREHAHNQDFGFHTDGQADVLGLLCIKQAKEGGVSGWSSTLAVHNEMLLRGRADLVACLAGSGWYRDRARYQDLAPGECPVWDMPVFAYHDGRLTVHYNASHYKLCAKRYPDIVKPLSPKQLEAIEMFEEIASDPIFKFEMRMQPGDVLFLNNSAALHARSAFQDGDAEHERRHLVRLWLAVADGPKAPAHLAFPRSYSTAYDRAGFVGLMKPDPDAFHVPLSSESDDV